MNTIYLKTVKAEHEGTKLSRDLKRVLSLFDGRSGSDDLSRRAAPSLRIIWSELISELVKGGYIISNPRVTIAPKNPSVPRSGVNAPANVLEHKKERLLVAEQVIAALETAETADKAKLALEMQRTITILKAAEEAGKAKSDIEAKARADPSHKVENAAATAELKPVLAAAQANTTAEIRQPEKKAVPVRAEMKAAVIAKDWVNTEATLNAGKKEREQEQARTNAEIETAINSAKTGSVIAEQSRSELKSKFEMHESALHRLHVLEIENQTLKQLLVEAYVEIAELKAALGIKP